MTKKIIDAKPYKNSISAPIIKIGVLAISISVLVMMVSVAVGLGMQKEIKDKLDIILKAIPNIPLKDVPLAKDEINNKEISKSGEIKKR